MLLKVNGTRLLHGCVETSGYKHSVLPILAECIAVPTVIRLQNAPRIKDVDNMCEAMRLLGARIRWASDDSLDVNTRDLQDCPIPADLTTRFHASYQLMPVMMRRFGHFQVGLPGGCPIGDRMPYGSIAVMRAFGIGIRVEDGHCSGQYASAASPAQVDIAQLGVDVKNLPAASKSALLLAAQSESPVILKNLYCGPEVLDLARFFSCMGYRVEHAGPKALIVGAPSVVRSPRADYRIMPDVIEAFTWLVVSAISDGQVLVRGVNPEYMTAEWNVLRAMGFELLGDGEVFSCRRREELHGVDVETGPYPAFNTDNHPALVALMLMARESSRLREGVWENRFAYVSELSKMVSEVAHVGNHVYVHPRGRVGRTVKVTCTDLRGGMALVLAALESPTDTLLENSSVISRGYAHFPKKIQALGADIEIVSDARLMD